eukprot:6866655-Prymnesium_polylepis.1
MTQSGTFKFRMRSNHGDTVGPWSDDFYGAARCLHAGAHAASLNDQGSAHERVNRDDVTMNALLLALATQDTHCRVDDVNALTCGDLETVLVDDLVGEYAPELRIVRIVVEPRVGGELATDWTVI